MQFEEEDYPIWAMNIGKNYVEGFLMANNGYYLEYHHDKPHFHMPLSEDASGHYILARRSGEKQYHITAFTIPFGKGVFTYKGAIHCDAALTGKLWMIGYTDTEDFSTVVLRTIDLNQKVQIDYLT